MIGRQVLERCPLLAAMTDELPFIFTNRAMRRRFCVFGKLRPALHTDKIFHRSQLLLDSLEAFQLETADDFADDAFNC